MSIKGAIFDQDGLLIDTEIIYGKCWKQAGVEFGIVVTDEYHGSLCGRGLKEVIQRAHETFPQIDPEAFVRRALSLSAKMQLACTPDVKPGAREILQYCKAHGIRTSVASSSTLQCVTHNLTVTGLIEYFDAITTGEEVTNGKPAPDIFLKAAEKLGVDPKDCVVFEDAPSGIQAAHAAGSLAVMVPDRVQPDAATRSRCRVFPTLTEALTVLSEGDTASTMTVDRAEVLRYMRMGHVQPDAILETRLSAVEREVLSVIRPTAYWQLVPVEGSYPSYRVGSLELTSERLWKTIAGCRHAFLFCATLGAGVDALLRRCGHRSAADLVMVQAVSTALIETFCDECQEKMLQEPAVCGESLRMRFSPGYGDLSLEVQKPLLTALDSSRRAGITLLDSLLMVPSKSVSAIIGVGPADGQTARHDCRHCAKTDCAFRATPPTSAGHDGA